MAMNALIALVRKDLVLYFSNRRALIMSVVAPIVIAAFFGALFDSGSSKKPARIPIAIVDLDKSEISNKIVASMKGDASFAIRDLAEPEAFELVRQGKVRAVAVLPKGFGDEAARAMFRPGSKPVITVLYDPSQAMALAVVRGLLTQHVMQSVGQSAFGGATSEKMIADARAGIDRNKDMSGTEKRNLGALFDSLQRLQEPRNGPANANTGTPRFEMPFETREQEVTSNADRKYNSYAHSFAGMGVQFILFMGIELGIGVLLARRLGLWKRLRAAPISRSILLGSRIVSGAITAIVLLLLIYAAAIALFGVRIDGSAIGFIGVGIAFALLTASFGLLIAALGRTPEATRGLAIFATLILVMLGGAWVPSFVFPEWLQTVSLFVPTRWAVDGLDAMTWRGLGLEAALAPIGVMLAFTALFAVIAVWRFDWEE
jgi:ABC-2 type transport system permease protein